MKRFLIIAAALLTLGACLFHLSEKRIDVDYTATHTR